jgi:hypothetical protein
MQPNGQLYFDVLDRVPEEDRQHLFDADEELATRRHIDAKVAALIKAEREQAADNRKEG